MVSFQYRYRSDATINFAVAANSLKSTSGMIWALCTAAQSNDIGKIKTIWIPKLSSTEIELEWKLECVDASIVEGYTVQYCPISAPKTLECKTPEITVIIIIINLYIHMLILIIVSYLLIIFLKM